MHGVNNKPRMKIVRWNEHALRNLADREIDRAVAESVLGDPGHEIPDPPGWRVLMRLYHDVGLGQEMLLRVVVEDAPEEMVVVTLYKTSQVQRYLVRWLAMKVQYDPETDTLTTCLRDERIKESEAVRPGVIADYGHDGGLVRLEVLRASKVVETTMEMQFAVGG